MLDPPLDSAPPPAPRPMRSGLSSLAALGLAVGVVWSGLLTAPSPLPASGRGLTALLDTDGDLLDDVLELRLGTDPNQADPDLDGRTDLEEYLLGSDPNVYDAPGSRPAAATSFQLELYKVGPDIILEFFALTQSQATSLRILRATEGQEQVFRGSDLQPFVVDSVTQASHMAGWFLGRVRLRLGSGWFEQHSAVAFGAVATLDGMDLADVLMLTHVGDELAEVQFRGETLSSSSLGSGMQSAGAIGLSGNASSGGQKSGGLFPVEPGSTGSSNGTPDEVCIQTLVPVANLGGGSVKYVVAEASCDPEPSAVCLPGCALTVDDSVIGIDVVGLLGG